MGNCVWCLSFPYCNCVWCLSFPYCIRMRLLLCIEHPRLFRPFQTRFSAVSNTVSSPLCSVSNMCVPPCFDGVLTCFDGVTRGTRCASQALLLPWKCACCANPRTRGTRRTLPRVQTPTCSSTACWSLSSACHGRVPLPYVCEPSTTAVKQTTPYNSARLRIFKIAPTIVI